MGSDRYGRRAAVRKPESTFSFHLFGTLTSIFGANPRFRWPCFLDVWPDLFFSSGGIPYRSPAVALSAKSSRSRRAQSVERADDARPIVSRRKRMRERRLGTPAGAVPRRDDTRPDTID